MQQRTWTQTLAYLAAWLVSSLIAFLDLWIAGSAVFQATVWFGTHRSEASRPHDLVTGSDFGWTVEFVSLAAALVLVCIGAAVIIGLEYYYRKGADKGILARRFVIATRNELVVAALGLAVVALTHIF